MADVVASFSMSLDGFVADASDRVGPLFDWYGNGDVAVRWPGDDMVAHASAASADHLNRLIDDVGALVVGRRLFDLADGWGGSHPLGVPVVVVSHSVPDGWPRDAAPFEFVTDGVGAAVARAGAIAGERFVGVGGADVARQCLLAGLLDEVRIDLVPVLLGGGVRLFDHPDGAPILLDDPTVVEATQVTHLRYRVRR